LARQTGKSGLALRKLVEGGKIGFPEISRAFEHMTGKGGKFFDMMKEQSLTVGGQLSNLKDKFSQSLLKIFDELKPQINSTIILLSKLTDQIIPMIKWIKDHSEVVKGLVIALGTGYLLTGILNATIAIKAMGVAMRANPIGLLITGISTLIALQITYAELKDKQEQKQFKSGVDEEIQRVRNLQKQFEKLGFAKDVALRASTIQERWRLTGEIEELKQKKLKNGNIMGYEDAINKEIAKKRGELTSLDSMLKADSNLKKTGNAFSDLKTPTTEGKTATAPLDLGTPSSSVKGQGIQNLTINIDKLVEALNITASNISESTLKIKEEVAKALLSAVNDVNILARN
jgi:hypothetical protein